MNGVAWKWSVSGLLMLSAAAAFAQDWMPAADRKPEGPLDTALVARLKEEFLKAPHRVARETVAKKMIADAKYGAPALLEAMDDWMAAAVSATPAGRPGTVPSRRGSARTDQKKDIPALQRTVMSLRDIPDLTKEEIVKTGDPAMVKLTSAFKTAARVEREAARGVAQEFDQYRAACLKAMGSEPDPVRAGAATSAHSSDFVGALYDRSKGREVQKWNQKQSPEVPRDVSEGVEDANRIRMLAGLNPLKMDVLLCKTAADHSQDMATLNFFDHTSPVKGKTTPWDRAKRFGTTASSENIFMGETSALAANASWFHSPGHFKNLMDPDVKFIGMGRYNSHWTQMFR